MRKTPENLKTEDLIAISHWRLRDVRPLGQGGMASIYCAYQSSLNRRVIIKKLKEAYSNDPELRARMQREANALAAVLHQNVAHVYDFVDDAQGTYILMEYIDGEDLSTIIKKLGAIPPRVAASILIGIASGVSYIHRKNLVHRDIKPSNIRINTLGEIKLMDFGIVYLEESASALTRPGVMVGSPYYLSPEQVLGETVTQQSDIFLMGICLYEMLTGSRPFKEEDGQTVFQRIRDTKYVPVLEMNSRIPKALAAIVERALQKNPSERYESAFSLISDLENFLGTRLTRKRDETILQYLDEEAILTPAMAVAASKDTDLPDFSSTIYKYLPLAAATAVGYLIAKTLPLLLS